MFYRLIHWLSEADGVRVLVVALITSLSTVIFIEPIKVEVQLCIQRRRIRRWLYREIIRNCVYLHDWVRSARRSPELQQHTSAQFASEFRRLAYDLAIKDGAFYALSHEEPYRIDKIYRELELIAHGSFEDAHDCFVRAEGTAGAVLIAVKDRSLSQWVAFRVSSKDQKSYFRENLPSLPYFNYDDPPKLRERLLRQLDALQYRLWRMRSSSRLPR